MITALLRKKANRPLFRNQGNGGCRECWRNAHCFPKRGVHAQLGEKAKAAKGPFGKKKKRNGSPHTGKRLKINGHVCRRRATDKKEGKDATLGLRNVSYELTNNQGRIRGSEFKKRL